MKKFAALLLTAAMTVAMVGCGSSVAANTVNSKDDLPGKKIGVQLGTTGDTDATAYEDEGSTVERYNKGSDAIQALKTGKIDCVIIDKQPAEAFVEKNDDLKILDDTFDAEEYAICIAKDNTDLTDEFNKAIEELKADGTIDTIISNYIGDEAGEHPYETPEGTEYPNGKLTMATNAQFEPYEYYDGDNVVGIDADIAKAICDKLGYDLEIEDMEADKMRDINRLKILLAEKKKTNKWLCEQLGVNPTTVSKWCTNSSQPSLEMVLKMMKVLDADINQIINLPERKQ